MPSISSPHMCRTGFYIYNVVQQNHIIDHHHHPDTNYKYKTRDLPHLKNQHHHHQHYSPSLPTSPSSSLPDITSDSDSSWLSTSLSWSSRTRPRPLTSLSTTGLVESVSVAAGSPAESVSAVGLITSWFSGVLDVHVIGVESPDPFDIKKLNSQHAPVYSTCMGRFAVTVTLF